MKTGRSLKLRPPPPYETKRHKCCACQGQACRLRHTRRWVYCLSKPGDSSRTVQREDVEVGAHALSLGWVEEMCVLQICDHIAPICLQLTQRIVGTSGYWTAFAIAGLGNGYRIS